jgi:hypothetical protein
VLAIGLDAAEPSLVRRLVRAGRLPHLARLGAAGAWGAVRSPAPLGSGAVWPTFLSGTPPEVHGIHGEWLWDPAGLRVVRPAPEGLVPFWRPLAEAGHAVTVLDVPFAPLAARPGCREVGEWGAHDRLTGRLAVWPASLEAEVRARGGVHPFASEVVDAAGPRDAAGLARVAALCRDGARRRGDLAAALLAEAPADLALVVFTEFHRAAHLLWHRVAPAQAEADRPGDPAGPPLASLPPGPSPDPLSGLLEEVDRQIGRLAEAAGPGASVLVFALHGMEPAVGVPTVLEPLLGALGFAALLPLGRQSWRERAAGALAAVKRRAPAGVKALYHRLSPAVVAARLVQPAMPVPAYDWARTVAFALPTDQHGWVRLNLAGREAHGVVPPAAYEATCARVAGALAAVTTEAGAPLVREILRPASGAEAPGWRLPDLVIHWSEATRVPEVRTRAPAVAARGLGLRLTGQHAPAGFYLWRPGAGGPPGPPDGIAAEALGPWLAAAVGRPAA